MTTRKKTVRKWTAAKKPKPVIGVDEGEPGSDESVAVLRDGDNVLAVGKIETADLTSLHEDPANARTHDGRNLKAIEAALPEADAPPLTREEYALAAKALAEKTTSLIDGRDRHKLADKLRAWLRQGGEGA